MAKLPSGSGEDPAGQASSRHVAADGIGPVARRSHGEEALDYAGRRPQGARLSRNRRASANHENATPPDSRRVAHLCRLDAHRRRACRHRLDRDRERQRRLRQRRPSRSPRPRARPRTTAAGSPTPPSNWRACRARPPDRSGWDQCSMVSRPPSSRKHSTRSRPEGPHRLCLYVYAASIETLVAEVVYSQNAPPPPPTVPAPPTPPAPTPPPAPPTTPSATVDTTEIPLRIGHPDPSTETLGDLCRRGADPSTSTGSPRSCAVSRSAG